MERTSLKVSLKELLEFGVASTLCVSVSEDMCGGQGAQRF